MTVTNLYDKKRYVLHYKIFLPYLKLRKKLKKVHSLLRFDPLRWLKPNIDFTTEKRNNACNRFDSKYGKTMKN